MAVNDFVMLAMASMARTVVGSKVLAVGAAVVAAVGGATGSMTAAAAARATTRVIAR